MSANADLLFHYQDALIPLTENLPLDEKLDYLRGLINQRHPVVSRIATALYDAENDSVKTFIHSSDKAPFTHYEARLSETASLRDIVHLGRPRVVHDLGIFANGRKEHSKRLIQHGFGSSYTLPLNSKGRFFGFLFFNSDRTHAFSDEVLAFLSPFAHLLSQTVIQEIIEMRTLQAAVATIREVTCHRDNETGQHLQRMARFARLIGQELANRLALSDEYVEYIYIFAPLHDVGKVAIPDHILLKPGKLTREEYDIMKTHTEKGREIVEAMLRNFGLESFKHATILRNIVEDHHESLDGSGYMRRLGREEIPLEARIVAVADVFDALTSKRPYKERWTNQAGFDFLQEFSGKRFDPDCVDALIHNRERVEAIQRQFPDGSPAFGPNGSIC